MAFKRAIAGVCVLAALGVWSWYSDPYPSLPKVLEHAVALDGRQVEGFGEATVAYATDDGFVLISKGAALQVRTDVPVADPGTYVSVAGTFRAPDRLEADAVHFAKGRRIKIVVSLLPLAVLFVFAPLMIRFDPRERALTFRGTRHA